MPQTRHLPANPKLSLPFYKTPSRRSATEPSTGHFVMNISPPDRTTFSGLSSFYTVLWHITLKAICKITEFLTCLKHATSRPIQVFPHILQNTFRAIGHRTAHRPLCHEYLAPDRTTFSSLSSFYTVLWHITLKAIRKNISIQKMGRKT